GALPGVHATAVAPRDLPAMVPPCGGGSDDSTLAGCSQLFRPWPGGPQQSPSVAKGGRQRSMSSGAASPVPGSDGSGGIGIWLMTGGGDGSVGGLGTPP